MSGPDRTGPPQDGGAAETSASPHVEAEAWVDWIGSQQCHHLDEATRAFIHAAFAAGFEAGWRKHLHAAQPDAEPGGSAA